MDSGLIKSNITMLENAIQKLSTEIGNASVLWKDNKYSELSNSIVSIATESKSVIISADRVCSSIEKFKSIATEKY